MIHACVYEGQYNPVPIEQTDFTTFGELADAITDLVAREYQDKAHMLAWAPHRLREPHRCIANVVEVSVVALDVDRFADGDGPAQLVERAKQICSEGLVYETSSSKATARRVRVVLPVKAHAAGECKPLRLAAAEALGIDARPKTSGVYEATDPSRLWFAGRLIDTPEREVWRW